MTFATFLDELNAQKKETEVKFDPQKEIEEYVDYLDKLYSIFEESLHPYVDEGKLQIEKRNVRIQEDSLGLYEVPQLILKLNNVNVRLSPEGTMLIGAKGRVRMSGPKGFAKIILMKKNFSMQWMVNSGSEKKHDSSENPWIWRFVSSDNRDFIDVTVDSVQDVIMELVNG